MGKDFLQWNRSDQVAVGLSAAFALALVVALVVFWAPWNAIRDCDCAQCVTEQDCVDAGFYYKDEQCGDCGDCSACAPPCPSCNEADCSNPDASQLEACGFTTLDCSTCEPSACCGLSCVDAYQVDENKQFVNNCVCDGSCWKDSLTEDDFWRGDKAAQCSHLGEGDCSRSFPCGYVDCSDQVCSPWGECLECFDTSDCARAQVCCSDASLCLKDYQYTCVECVHASDCSAGRVCCNDPAQCLDASRYLTCVGCLDSDDCSGDSICCDGSCTDASFCCTDDASGSARFGGIPCPYGCCKDASGQYNCLFDSSSTCCNQEICNENVCALDKNNDTDASAVICCEDARRHICGTGFDATCCDASDASGCDSNGKCCNSNIETYDNPPCSATYDVCCDTGKEACGTSCCATGCLKCTETGFCKPYCPPYPPQNGSSWACSPNNLVFEEQPINPDWNFRPISDDYVNPATYCSQFKEITKPGDRSKICYTESEASKNKTNYEKFPFCYPDNEKIPFCVEGEDTRIYDIFQYCAKMNDGSKCTDGSGYCAYVDGFCVPNVEDASNMRALLKSGAYVTKYGLLTHPGAVQVKPPECKTYCTLSNQSEQKASGTINKDVCYSTDEDTDCAAYEVKNCPSGCNKGTSLSCGNIANAYQYSTAGTDKSYYTDSSCMTYLFEPNYGDLCTQDKCTSNDLTYVDESLYTSKRDLPVDLNNEVVWIPTIGPTINTCAGGSCKNQPDISCETESDDCYIRWFDRTKNGNTVEDAYYPEFQTPT